MSDQPTTEQATQKKQRNVLQLLERLPQRTLGAMVMGILETVRADRERAFLDMIKTSASKDKAEDEKAFYMGIHKALDETYNKIATIIAEHGIK